MKSGHNNFNFSEVYKGLKSPVTSDLIDVFYHFFFTVTNYNNAVFFLFFFHYYFEVWNI